MPYKDPEKAKESKKAYEEKRKGTRFTTWSLIFYPDSAPEEWRDMLRDLHLRIWVSPIHDMDCWTAADEKKNPEHCAGLLKKPHFHLIVEYPNPTSMDDVTKDFDFLNGNSYIVRVRDKIPMVRYLIHQDDPEKAQYSADDIFLCGGATTEFIDMVGTFERHQALREMRRYIVANEIVDFFEFVLYCDDCMEMWSRLLDDNSSYVIERFIKSFRAAKLGRHKSTEE